MEAIRRVYVVEVDPERDIYELRDQLLQDRRITIAEPNFVYHAADRLESHREIPNDPFFASHGGWGQAFPDLWGIFAIDAPSAWLVSEGAGTVVAVVDTGVDVTHPDLRRNLWRNANEIAGNRIDDDQNGFVDDIRGWDFTRCRETAPDGTCLGPKRTGPNVRDRAGHGTHVAGIIAASGNNDIGIIGVAPQATILPVKALDATGRGSTLGLAGAIIYAADNGASVINASWSGPPSEFMRMAIDYASVLDVVVVTAAGNDGVSIRSGVSPAEIPGALAVGATTADGAIARFSNRGGPLGLVAPGGGDSEPSGDVDSQRSILSLLARRSTFERSCRYEFPCEDCTEVLRCSRSPFVVGGKYLRASGTSMATAFVSGVAALVRSRHPEFVRQQVRQVLFESADDLGPRGWDRTFGYGQLNAFKAVSLDSVPVAEILAPTNGEKIQSWQLPFSILGTALVPRGVLEQWRLTIRNPETNELVLDLTGSMSVQRGVFATIEESSFVPGTHYVIRLEVSDTLGNQSHDTKEFHLPNLRFVPVPLPAVLQGSTEQKLDDSGERLLASHPDSAGEGATWLFDARTNEVLLLGRGFTLPGWLNAAGDVASYGGALPNGKRCHDLPLSGVVYFAGGTYECLLQGISPTTAAVDGSGLRGVFTSNQRFNASVDNPDGTFQLYFFDQLLGSIQQLTKAGRGVLGDTTNEISSPAMSEDGGIAVFDSSVSLDPTSPFEPDRTRHIFRHDIEHQIIRRLTGTGKSAPDGRCASLSRDGRALAFLSSEGIFVGDPLLSDDLVRIVDASDGPGCPRVTGDGTLLFFASGADLDASVGNEDGSVEIFYVDIETRQIVQVTDGLPLPDCNPTIFSCGSHVEAVNFDGRIIAGDMTFAPQNVPVPLLMRSPRLIRRATRTSPPELQIPASVTLSRGKRTITRLTATDREGGRIVFLVQRNPWSRHAPIEKYAGYEFDDYGDGTADLSFMPTNDDTGAFRVRVAAFDTSGEVSVGSIRFVID